MALSVPLSVRILLEIRLLLVYGVVGQMHTHVGKVDAVRGLVLLSGKACEALLVKVAPEGRNSGDQHVEPQIELQTVDEERFVEVLLGHVMLSGLHPLEVASEEDSLALARLLWLHNKSFSPLFVELLLEKREVLRQDPSLREKIVFFGHHFLHA